MNVGRGRIDPKLDLKGTTKGQLGLQLLLTEYLGTASNERGEVIGKGAHGTESKTESRPLVEKFPDVVDGEALADGFFKMGIVVERSLRLSLE
jgi:hypothetical protein